MKKLIVSAIATKRVQPGMIAKDSPFPGISYILMETDGNKLYHPLDFLDEGISESDVPTFWEEAEANTKADTNCSRMSCFIGIPDQMKESIFVLTNQNGVYVAGCLCNNEAIEKAFEQFDCERLIMLPSSVHEVLLIPYSDNTDAAKLYNMVTEINQMDFVGDAKLIDMAYSFTLEEYHNNAACYANGQGDEWHDYIESVPTKLEKLLCRDIDFLKAIGTEFKPCATIEVVYRIKEGDTQTHQFTVSKRINTEAGRETFYDMFSYYENEICTDDSSCSKADNVVSVHIIAMADTVEELNEIEY